MLFRKKPNYVILKKMKMILINIIIILINMDNNNAYLIAELDQIKKRMSNNRRIIYDLQKTIRSIEDEIKKDRDELYKKCPHKWVPDHSYNNYDRTPFVCQICNLDS